MALENYSLARRGAWFGLLAAATSSPGQTFFIGLFGASLRDSFQLSDAALGSLYGAATLASGLLMFWLGELADRLALRRAISVSVALVAAGAALLASAQHVVQLVLALFLLRLGGQGLTGHFAIVAAARFAVQRRGRSVAVASFGFILGEALYPLMVTLALGATGWRWIWFAIACLLLTVYLPALRGLAAPLPTPAHNPAATAATEPGDWNRRRLFGSPAFLAILGVVLVPPFVITALFFHQTTLAARLGWSAASVAHAFMLFAFCQAFATLLAGRLVDRFDARALLRVYLLPLAAGMFATFTVEPAIALWLLFAGVGIAAGGNSVVGGAIWVEVFGSRRLGLVRGMYAALMVLSTAASPALLGALLSAGFTLPAIFLPMIVYIVAVPLLLAPLVRTQASASLESAS